LDIAKAVSRVGVLIVATACGQPFLSIRGTYRDQTLETRFRKA